MFGREFQLVAAVQWKAHPEIVVMCNDMERSGTEHSEQGMTNIVV